MSRKPKPRTQEFLWHSRQELYSYFEQMHGLARTDVDDEILRTMETFRPRTGNPIEPRELWQKTGIELERRMRKAKGK